MAYEPEDLKRQTAKQKKTVPQPQVMQYKRKEGSSSNFDPNAAEFQRPINITNQYQNFNFQLSSDSVLLQPAI